MIDYYLSKMICHVGIEPTYPQYFITTPPWQCSSITKKSLSWIMAYIFCFYIQSLFYIGTYKKNKNGTLRFGYQPLDPLRVELRFQACKAWVMNRYTMSPLSKGIGSLFATFTIIEPHKYLSYRGSTCSSLKIYIATNSV